MMNAKLQAALEDCTKAIVSDTSQQSWMMVSALLTCVHNHNVIVINDGKSVITTSQGIDCLRSRGVSI